MECLLILASKWWSGRLRKKSALIVEQSICCDRSLSSLFGQPNSKSMLTLFKKDAQIFHCSNRIPSGLSSAADTAMRFTSKRAARWKGRRVRSSRFRAELVLLHSVSEQHRALADEVSYVGMPFSWLTICYVISVTVRNRWASGQDCTRQMYLWM